VNNKRINFVSSFNNKNIFFGGTNMIIPGDHIIDVQKVSYKKTLDTSLLIKTSNGDITFTNFANREEAYNHIMTSFKLKPLSEVQSQLEHSTSLNQTQNLQDSSIISFYQSNQEQFLIREAKIMQTINPPQYYDKNVGLSFQIQHKCDITKIYNAILSN
jgi:hypothetical protein